MTSARTACSLRAYALWEELQGEHHREAAAALPALLAEAQAHDWPEAAFVACAAQAAYELVRPSGTRPDLAGLLVRAGADPALRAQALALMALAAAVVGDTETVLASAGQAVALLDDEGPAALDRCTGYVVCAAAYNALSLWELVDELYAQAQALVPLCPVPVQAPALAVNRVLIRGEWATTLLETGRDEQAAVQLVRALEAARAAHDVALPTLWARDVAAWETALGLLLGEAEDSDDDRLLMTAAVQRQELAAADDLESLPGLDACRALALLRAGRSAEAAVVVDQLRDTPTSSSSGATSFLAWARARVLDPAAWDGPTGDYARLVAEQRWEARRAVLVAARSFVALERLQADHRRLTRDLTLDVLTGLTNRRASEQWRALPPDAGTHAVLLLVDLDDFKGVNDTFGHRTGDDVLREVGRLIAEQVRPGDLTSRHGGDEFVVAYGHPDATDEAALERGLALRRAVRGHDWSALGSGLAVDVSIGVAVGAFGDTADALYARADTALYAAKREGGGVVLALPPGPALDGPALDGPALDGAGAA